MFFKISKKIENNFPINYTINGVVFNFDLGWEKFKFDDVTIFFKGYILNKDPIEDTLLSLIKDNNHSLDGNFTAILCYDNNIVITHDINRGYPLWHDDDVVTNLEVYKNNVWSNKFVNIDYYFNLELLDVNLKKRAYETLSYDAALKNIYDIIANKFEMFLSNNKNPLKIFLSGGVDTTTLYSFLKKFTKNFEVIDYEYKKFTKFYKANWHNHIRKFWAYNQMHTWGDVPISMITGGCGDEYLIRGPVAINLMNRHHDIDMIKLLESNKNCYHYRYFMEEKNVKTFSSVPPIDFEKIKSNKSLVIKYILNNLLNDHQHWHIDKTIFFTPFKDIELANIVLRLDKKDFIKQIINAQINKDLISMNNPDDLKIISKYKNTNTLENL